LVLLMKASLQTLPPKAGRAETPDARPGSADVEVNSSAIPQRRRAAGESAPPAQGEKDAGGEPGHLAIELGHFIARVPPRLLKLGEFDTNRPLLFDMGTIADRIVRGIFTIPLSELLKAAPEIFVDGALTQPALEIRFPWQRVVDLVNESAASQKVNGGETLAQQLRRRRKIIKRETPAAAHDGPAEIQRVADSQVKHSAGVGVENRETEPGSAAQSTRSGVEELETVKSERDRLAGLLLLQEQRAYDLAAKVETAKADALRGRPEAQETALARAHAEFLRKLPDDSAEMGVKLASLIAERDEALSRSRRSQEEVDQVIAQAAAREVEFETRNRDAAQLDADIAQYRERIKTVLAERNALARTVEEGRAEHATALDAALSEWQKAEALAASQAAAHERVAAQWEADVATYRQRLQLVIGEKTTLAAKLRAAEIALQVIGGSDIGTAA
jgi:hypothetical protein